MRFGGSFDYDAHAVSVGQGGVIPRAALDTPIPAGHIVQLIVEDIDTRRRVPNFPVECSTVNFCHSQILHPHVEPWKGLCFQTIFMATGSLREGRGAG